MGKKQASFFELLLGKNFDVILKVVSCIKKILLERFLVFVEMSIALCKINMGTLKHIFKRISFKIA